MRLFFAIALPDDLRATLAGLETPVEGIRWIPEANLHLTLRFIGSVEADRIAEIRDAARGVSARRFNLPIGRVGAFPSSRKPRVLWAGCESSPELESLYESLDRSLDALDLNLEDRPFSPHISVGRVRRGQRPDLTAWMDVHRDFSAYPITVDAFHLFSSELQPSGAVYRVQESYPLLDVVSSNPSIE